MSPLPRMARALVSRLLDFEAEEALPAMRVSTTFKLIGALDNVNPGVSCTKRG